MVRILIVFYRHILRDTPMAPRWNDLYYDADGNIEVKAQNKRSPGLSNLFPFAPYTSPKLDIAGFGSVETAYQFAKAAYFDQRLSGPQYSIHIPEAYDSIVLREQFPATLTAREAKSRGGKGAFSTAIASVYGNKAAAGRLYDEILPWWFHQSAGVMRCLIGLKFSDENPQFKELLLSTGDAKIYEGRRRRGNVWERGANIPGITTSGWGLLGDLLMQRREELR